MTKTALIESLAAELGVSKRMAGELVNAFIETVMKGVKKEGEVRIQGFGNLRELLELELILKIQKRRLRSLQWTL